MRGFRSFGIRMRSTSSKASSSFSFASSSSKPANFSKSFAANLKFNTKSSPFASASKPAGASPFSTSASSVGGGATGGVGMSSSTSAGGSITSALSGTSTTSTGTGASSGMSSSESGDELSENATDPCNKKRNRIKPPLWKSNPPGPSHSSSLSLPVSTLEPPPEVLPPVTPDPVGPTWQKRGKGTYTLLDVKTQFINNVMKDGKKARATEQVNTALHIMKSKIDKHNASQEASKDQDFEYIGKGNETPTEFLEMAIDRTSPLVRLISERKGSKVVQTPRPMHDKRRRRTGIMWVIVAAKGRNNKTPFAERLGNELFTILEGTSHCLQKRDQVHKTALANRSNVVLKDRKRV